MPPGLKENRTPITRSVLVRTNEMIEEIARQRQCSLANVIDLAVAELYSRVMVEPVLAEVAPVAEPANKE